MPTEIIENQTDFCLQNPFLSERSDNLKPWQSWRWKEKKYLATEFRKYSSDFQMKKPYKNSMH